MAVQGNMRHLSHEWVKDGPSTPSTCLSHSSMPPCSPSLVTHHHHHHGPSSNSHAPPHNKQGLHSFNYSTFSSR
jgi:hypothetical protein